MPDRLRIGSLGEPTKFSLVVEEVPRPAPLAVMVLVEVREWDEPREEVYLDREGATELRDWLDGFLGGKS